MNGGESQETMRKAIAGFIFAKPSFQHFFKGVMPCHALFGSLRFLLFLSYWRVQLS
jgi:hypothetical protein